MANFSALIADIQAYVKQNGNNDIEGNGLQQILVAMVNSIGGASNEVAADLAAEVTARGNADTAETTAREEADGLLQTAINGIKANIDNGYVFAGIATPSGIPTTGKIFYLTTQAGTYINYGGLVVPAGISILKYDSEWSQSLLVGIDGKPTRGSHGLPESGGTYDEIFNVDEKVGIKDFETLSITKDMTTESLPLHSGTKVSVENTGAATIIVFLVYDDTTQDGPFYIAPNRKDSFQFEKDGHVEITSLVGNSSCTLSVLGLTGDVQELRDDIDGKNELVSISQEEMYYFNVKSGDVIQVINTGSNTLPVYTVLNGNNTFIGYAPVGGKLIHLVGDEEKMMVYAYYGEASATIHYNGIREDVLGIKESIEGEEHDFTLAQSASFESDTLQAGQRFEVATTGENTLIVFFTETGQSPVILDYVASGRNYVGEAPANGIVSALANYGETSGTFTLLGILDEIKLLQELKDDTVYPNSVNIFKRVGCIGDSYTEGYIQLDGEEAAVSGINSWTYYLSKKTGNYFENFGVSGSTVKGWMSGAAKLSLVQSAGHKCSAYIIGLQINDADPQMPYSTNAGVASDIGTDNDTYAAWYYKLVQALITVNSSAKIFCLTCPMTGNSDYNQRVRDVVEYCHTRSQNVYLVDLVAKKYDNVVYWKNPTLLNDYTNGHYTAVGYEFFGECLFRMISETINDNESEFKNSFKIPYDIYSTEVDGVFDISAYNATGGTLATYADLEAALGVDGANVPQSLRKGGMSVKFVHNTDNKYVQCRLTADTWSTNPNDWCIAADVLGSSIDEDFAITDDENNAIVIFNNGHVQTKKFNSSVDASPQTRGLMSALDKNKLNSIEPGAEVNTTEVQDNFDDCDLALTDEEGNAVVIYGKGHIKTKKFDSSDVSGIKDNVEIEEGIDFALMDNNNNAIAEFLEGHIKTKKFNSKVAVLNTGLRGMMGSFSGYNIITVGVGKDYTNIQDAINSVTDARIDNQYLVIVYDDYYVNTVTDLYLKDNKAQKATLNDINNGKECAYIYTKDFVHILGKGKRTIHVDIPISEISTNAQLQYVHNVYWKGYCNIENLQIISKNTRYCIHSEGGHYEPRSEDYCVIKNLINVDCIYYTLGLGYDHAIGIGTGNGQKMYIKGCKFIGKDGAKCGCSHTHPYYTFPTTLYFENTILESEGVESSFHLDDLFSGQNNNFILIGCNTKYVSIQYSTLLRLYQDSDFDMTHTRINLHGNSNKTRMDYENWPVIKIKTNNIGENITSVTGDAITSIFGSFYKKIYGGANDYTIWIGSLAHFYSSSDTIRKNYASLGYNLGDCSVNNKTLVIVVGEHSETVLFDKNYGGLVGGIPIANYSDDEIIAEINSQLQYCSISKSAQIRRLYFEDEVEMVYNNSEELISIDKILKKDVSQPYYNSAVKMTESNNDIVYGIAAEAIPPHSYGYMIKRGCQRIWLTAGNHFGLSDISGKYYTASSDGTLQVTTNLENAVLYGTDGKTLDWV